MSMKGSFMALHQQATPSRKSSIAALLSRGDADTGRTTESVDQEKGSLVVLVGFSRLELLSDRTVKH
jgi:hypothetical protein